jgi:hypothetical protein
MTDKDSHSIFEAYSESSTGSMTRDDPRYDQLVSYYIRSDGASRREAEKMAVETLRRMNAKNIPVVKEENPSDIIKSWEIQIKWPNRQGTTTGIGDKRWKSAKHPTDDDLKKWIARDWDTSGKIMSNAAKADVVDPMEFEFRVLGSYSPGEDRGSVGFKKGNRPLHGG